MGSTTVGPIKGDTRSLDSSSHKCIKVQGFVVKPEFMGRLPYLLP